MAGVTERWAAQLWASVSDIYAAILAHPFLDGLTSGSLPRPAFTYYVAQDSHFLRDYARALAVVGAKAPTHADTGMFARHAAETVDVEFALHTTLLASLGLTPADLDGIPVAPTTRAYTSYMLAVASCGSFAEGLAAILPCYWIYAAVGEVLVAQGSPEPSYQIWIDTYGGEEFAASVAEVLALADRTGRGLGAEDSARAGAHFVAAARYEWMFWDAAWRQETWPI
jgi:thiaminase/transcriptional activator TenA